MTNGITWEEELLTRIREARDKQTYAQETIRQVESDVKYWDEYATALERTIQLYRQGLNTNGHHTLDTERLRTQSTWANLVDILSANNGLLVVVDATTTLVKAGVFHDREHARNVIYATLYSHKKDIQKVRKGIYRLDARNDTEGKAKRTARKERIPGLKRAILELKTVNPDMTKQDVRETLVKRGFDFKGKNPNKVVHILWVNLGYAKKDKLAQQNLFET